MKMIKVILILVGILCVSSETLNKNELMTELTELTQELHLKNEEGETTVGDLIVPEVITKAPDAVTAEQEEEVKVSALEKLFSKLGGVLGKKLEKAAKRYEKKARKIRKIAKRIFEELDITVEKEAIDGLASQFEDKAKSLRQIADETEIYFDGADERLQDIMSRAPSSRHASRMRKKINTEKKTNRIPTEHKKLSTDNTDTETSTENTETTENENSGLGKKTIGTVSTSGSSLEWLVKELRE